MGKKSKPAAGVYLRNGTWYIDTWVQGRRIHGSTRASDRKEAKKFLARILEEDRQATIYGVRPLRTFAQAAIRYLQDLSDSQSRSFNRNAQDLRQVVPWIGDLPLHQVHAGTLKPFIEKRQSDGVAAGTINRVLAITRLVLNLAARSWRDENGLTWLQESPMIPLLPDRQKRQPFPLTIQEQALLMSCLPQHLVEMVSFAIATGAREQEICKLEWSWEIPIPELQSFVFVVPAHVAKSGRERVLVLNSAARDVVNRQRGRHPEKVFTYPVTIHSDPQNRRSPITGVDYRPVTKIYNSAWKRARCEAAGQYGDVVGRACPDGFARVRVHDLRHTFGRRLRALGVSLEDRQDLLGHVSGRITTHYSAAEVGQLMAAVEKLVEMQSHQSPTTTVLRLLDMANKKPLFPIKKQGLRIGGDKWI